MNPIQGKVVAPKSKTNLGFSLHFDYWEDLNKDSKSFAQFDENWKLVKDNKDQFCNRESLVDIIWDKETKILTASIDWSNSTVCFNDSRWTLTL
jgi:hypothetical protein